jgi:serine/threonine protein phosphatase 1
MKIWGIGDIHGCYREMMALYKTLLEAGLKPEKDLVIFMGDYLDRGPDSKKVVEQLIKWHKQYPHWVFLYGNHEDILKNWMEGKQKYQEDYQWSCFLYNGGKDTLRSYSLSEPVKALPKAHLKFLFEETKVLFETDKYIFVHGGLIPNDSIENIKKLMKDEASRETIVNAMLWAREGFIDSDWDWGKKVIFGHSAAFKSRWGKFGQPIIMKNKIGIDGAVCPSGNKNLIAVELPEERFYLQESFALYDALQNI